jgi:hypothetical protein
LYILTFTFLDSRRDDKRLWTESVSYTVSYFLTYKNVKCSYWMVNVKYSIALCPIKILMWRTIFRRETLLVHYIVLVVWELCSKSFSGYVGGVCFEENVYIFLAMWTQLPVFDSVVHTHTATKY